jgi:membrane-bound serine protease (ClpP class)
MIRRTFLLTWIMIAILLPVSASPVQAQAEAPQVLLLTAEGPLTPTMLGYLERGLDAAELQGAEALILMLDTPGGSVDLMNEIVQVGETMEAKEKNILKALVRSLAEERGEEAIQIAEDTIETAHAVSATEAYQSGLVDFIANNVPDLLEQLDGYQVTTVDGETTLDTANALVVPFDPTFIESLLGVLTNPNIVFLLLTVGVQAVLIELSSPGGWIAGFIGAVCLALAAYGLGVLPVNWFGLIFLAIAFVLFVMDIKTPTLGALTAAGAASLIVGSLVLFNSPGTPSFLRVSVPLVIGVSLGTAAIFLIILTIALRAQRAPISMGQESLIGRTGTAASSIAPTGTIQLGGELWTSVLAQGEEPIAEGTQVEVIEVRGVRVIVRKMD